MFLSDTTPVKFPSTCQLQVIKQWSQATHLCGLVAHHATLALNEKYFSCCAATGVYLTNSATSVAVRCNLMDRLTNIVALLRCFHQDSSLIPIGELLGIVEASVHANDCNASTRAAVERWRGLNLRQCLESNRGRMLSDVVSIPVRSGSVLQDTLPALACLVWHDNFQVLLHRHGRGMPPISQWIELIQKNKTRRSILFIEDVHDLWEPSLQDDFEQIISFANNVGLPLWVLMRPKNKTNSAGQEAPQELSRQSTKFKAGIQRRITAFKSQGIEQYISRQALSRLQQVCDLPIVASKRP